MGDTASEHSPTDPHNLARFVLEQEGIYPTALAELQAGRKRTHWMWFIFPQVAGLGSSPMAEMFAINSLEEARAYLAHPLLGPRLRECAAALLAHRNMQAVQIMGEVDALKLRSCMTLFTALDSDGSPFNTVLDTFFASQVDPMTTEVLATWAANSGAAPMTRSMWEQPEVATRFAERPVDHRLVKLMAGEAEFAPVLSAWNPGIPIRALDVGCAGGRNTVWLAAHGADVYALDASHAMVNETRRRLSPLLGHAEATKRVVHGTMTDLGTFATDMFDLVIALGVLQNAQTDDEWHRALSEVARVLRPGGLVLVANFGPDSAPRGTPLTHVTGTLHVWTGFNDDQSRMTLPDLDDLDRHFKAQGLVPALPTERVIAKTESGHRTTLNAIYIKLPPKAKP